jgi:hypothetical protein
MSDGFEQVIGDGVNRYNLGNHFFVSPGFRASGEILLASLPLTLLTSNLS